MTDWRTRHRGPYRLVVTRPGKKFGFIATEWLKGTVDSDDVEHEARTLIADPRDKILRVAVWSVREEQFVMTYAEDDGEAERAA